MVNMRYYIKCNSMIKIIQSLESIWYQKKKPPILLIILSKLFGLLTESRRTLYKIGILSSSKPDIPVIVIGNLNIGGTGKTPLTLFISEILSQLNKNVGIVLRGYKGKKSNSTPIIMDKDSRPEDFGDEAIYLNQKSNALVCVCTKRAKAAKLLSEKGVDIILSDDGLQHLGLKRDLEFGVVSSSRLFGNEYLLPAGPLRETLEHIKLLDIMFLNGQPNDEYIEANILLNFEVFNQKVKNYITNEVRSIDYFIDREITLIAGIGDPEYLESQLSKIGIKVDHIHIADHEKLDLDNIKDLQARTIFMTPKDLIKYTTDELSLETWELIPEIRIEDSQKQILTEKILEVFND